MEDLFGNLGHRWLHTAIADTKLTNEKPLEVERGRFYVLCADIGAHGHIGSRPGYALLTSHGKATKPRKDEFRDRVETIIERNSTGNSKDECIQRQNR